MYKMLHIMLLSVISLAYSPEVYAMMVDADTLHQLEESSIQLARSTSALNAAVIKWEETNNEFRESIHSFSQEVDAFTETSKKFSQTYASYVDSFEGIAEVNARYEETLGQLQRPDVQAKIIERLKQLPPEKLEQIRAIARAIPKN